MPNKEIEKLFYLTKTFTNSEVIDLKTKIAKNVKGKKLEALFCFLLTQEDINNLNENYVKHILGISKALYIKNHLVQLIFIIESHLSYIGLDNPLEKQLFVYKRLNNIEHKKKYLEFLCKKSMKEFFMLENRSPNIHWPILFFFHALYRHPKTKTDKPKTLEYLNQSEMNLDILYAIESLRLWIDKANTTFIEGNKNNSALFHPLEYHKYKEESPTLYIYLYVYDVINHHERTKIGCNDFLKRNIPYLKQEDEKRIFIHLSYQMNYHLLKEERVHRFSSIYELCKIIFESRTKKNQTIGSQNSLLIAYFSFQFKDRNYLEMICHEWRKKELSNETLKTNNLDTVCFKFFNIMLPFFDYLAENIDNSDPILNELKKVKEELKELNNNIINRSWLKYLKA